MSCVAFESPARGAPPFIWALLTQGIRLRARRRPADPAGRQPAARTRCRSVRRVGCCARRLASLPVWRSRQRPSTHSQPQQVPRRASHRSPHVAHRREPLLQPDATGAQSEPCSGCDETMLRLIVWLVPAGATRRRCEVFGTGGAVSMPRSELCAARSGTIAWGGWRASVDLGETSGDPGSVSRARDSAS